MSKGCLWLKKGLSVEYRQKLASERAGSGCSSPATPAACGLARRRRRRRRRVAWKLSEFGSQRPWFREAAAAREVSSSGSAGQPGSQLPPKQAEGAWQRSAGPGRRGRNKGRRPAARRGAQVRGDAHPEPGAPLRSPAPNAHRSSPQPWESPRVLSYHIPRLHRGCFVVHYRSWRREEKKKGGGVSPKFSSKGTAAPSGLQQKN